MNFRLNKNQLLEILGDWNRFLKRRVHLIACGGTAMTLNGVKPSTKDADFMAPKTREHDYLTKQLKAIGYNDTITLEIFSEDCNDLVTSREKINELFQK